MAGDHSHVTVGLACVAPGAGAPGRRCDEPARPRRVLRVGGNGLGQAGACWSPSRSALVMATIIAVNTGLRTSPNTPPVTRRCAWPGPLPRTAAWPPSRSPEARLTASDLPRRSLCCRRCRGADGQWSTARRRRLGPPSRNCEPPRAAAGAGEPMPRHLAARGGDRPVAGVAGKVRPVGNRPMFPTWPRIRAAVT
jgi:hypothetical protein